MRGEIDFEEGGQEEQRHHQEEENLGKVGQGQEQPLAYREARGRRDHRGPDTQGEGGSNDGRGQFSDTVGQDKSCEEKEGIVAHNGALAHKKADHTDGDHQRKESQHPQG